MARNHTFARSLHDLGAAAWFGSTLMGAAAVNRAPADIVDPVERSRAVNGVWRRWWPVNLASLVAHAAGGYVLTTSNVHRLVGQRNVGTLATAKAVITGAGLAATGYAGLLGKRIDAAGPVPIGDGTSPADGTPARVASALRQQRALQWALPVLSGTAILVSTALGESQRPSQVLAGVVQRVDPFR